MGNQRRTIARQHRLTANPIRRDPIISRDEKDDPADVGKCHDTPYDCQRSVRLG